MKKLLFLFVAMFSLSVYGQEIKKNEKDEFTGAHVIETSWEKTVWQLKPDMCMYARFRVINGSYILDIKCMRNGSLVVTPEDPIIFLDENNNTFKFYPTGTFIGDRGAAAVKRLEEASWGILVHYDGDFSFLENSTPVKVRWYMSDGYVDGEIKKKNQNNLPELYRLTMEELPK